MVVNHPQNWMMKNKVSLFVKFPPFGGFFIANFIGGHILAIKIKVVL